MATDRFRILLAGLIVACLWQPVARAQKPQLTIEQIMQDPKWMGTSPARIFWSEDGRYIYFMWNPEGEDLPSLYKIDRRGGTPQKVSIEEKKRLPSPIGYYSRDYREKVYEKNGDIFILDIRRNRIRQITDTLQPERDPRFTHDERGVTFIRGFNLFLWDRATGKIEQLTDFRKGKKPPEEPEPKTPQEKWLKSQQLELFQVLRKRKDLEKKRKEQARAEAPPRPLEIYIEDQQVDNLRLSPDRRYIFYRLVRRPRNAKRTVVPNYVTETGFTENIPSRTKVGAPQPQYTSYIYDRKERKVYPIKTATIPGITERPAYLKKKTEEKEKATAKPQPRPVIVHGPYWSDNGQHGAVVVLSLDHKDRWIMLLDPATGDLKLLDRQHDEAWIGGPGIGGWLGPGVIGWMPDNRRVWFQSEVTGYSHLWTVDIETGAKKQLTNGNFEIYNPRISRNKKYWYFEANAVHPGERHFYRMPLDGGPMVQITRATGRHDVTLSPDEKWLAIRYSRSNRPWDLYLMENRPGAPMKELTDSRTDAFKAYPWREPEIVTFTARDGAKVYARLYQPEHPEPHGPAVIFVHGAGYLQNAHKWWSSYFREYMFHNFLVDHGYTVLDIDYRGSAGYGRDWRTAIYRHMGGKDLTDQVDGARFLVENYDIDPKRIGIYGGSYGGFITLMAMFTQPGVFAAGAALRPVTDWAHYNHPYTSNILNVPYDDPEAFRRSSPIYHAEGLQGALLICHGMIDTNVHFQDVVRLVQRLIELGKENWELAVYPLESHGFREPSSWTDEYRRIFRLFETYLKRNENY